MALVAPSQDNVSSIEKATRLREEQDRAARSKAACILNYQHRKATGQIPLEELIIINKRGNEQCS